MSAALDLLPRAVIPDLGPVPIAGWGGVPWGAATKASVHLDGLMGGGVAVFRPGHRALLAVTDASINTDGPGGSRTEDPDWLPHTSLKYAGGLDCNSHVFPGVVLPPAFRDYGVRVGDYALTFWRGAIRSAQVYDVGPKRLGGEISIYLARGLGIVKPETTNHYAATKGNDVQDLCTLFFPGSGDGRAHEPSVIVANCHRLWRAFTNRPD